MKQKTQWNRKTSGIRRTGKLVQQENQQDRKHSRAGKKVLQERLENKALQERTGNVVERTISRAGNLVEEKTYYNRKLSTTGKHRKPRRKDNLQNRKPILTGKNRKPIRSSNLV